MASEDHSLFCKLLRIYVLFSLTINISRPSSWNIFSRRINSDANSISYIEGFPIWLNFFQTISPYSRTAVEYSIVWMPFNISTLICVILCNFQLATDWKVCDFFNVWFEDHYYQHYWWMTYIFPGKFKFIVFNWGRAGG